MCLNVQVDFRNLTGPIKMDMLKRFIRSLKKEETAYEPKRLEFDDYMAAIAFVTSHPALKRAMATSQGDEQ